MSLLQLGLVAFWRWVQAHWMPCRLNSAQQTFVTWVGRCAGLWGLSLASVPWEGRLRLCLGHSNEDYLHPLSSAMWRWQGAGGLYLFVGTTSILRTCGFTRLIVLHSPVNDTSDGLFHRVLEAWDSWEWGNYKSKAAKLLRFISVLEETRTEPEKGRFWRHRGPSPQRSPHRHGREPPALPGGHPHVSGCGARGEELLSAVVNRLQRAAPRRAGRHGREAVGCCSRLSAAQRRAKKGFPTREVWAEGWAVSERPFSFALQLLPPQATSPTCFPAPAFSRQTLAWGSPALKEKEGSQQWWDMALHSCLGPPASPEPPAQLPQSHTPLPSSCPRLSSRQKNSFTVREPQSENNSLSLASTFHHVSPCFFSPSLPDCCFSDSFSGFSFAICSLDAGNGQGLASLAAHMVKNLPAMQEASVWSLGSIPGSGRSPREEKGYPL